MKTVMQSQLAAFREALVNEERSEATISKYLHDVACFFTWAKEKALCKETVLDYKRYLAECYAPVSVNSMLSALNSFFVFIERTELRIKLLKIQRQLFMPVQKELTKAEYRQLLQAAKQLKNERLYLLMQTICSTGIRVSELQFITAEAVSRGQAAIRCKGKYRTVFLPNQLCDVLKKYIKTQKITSGAVFVTKNGKPLDRSNIWAAMKRLCKRAGVSAEKVFPHNLRHLFARTYYAAQKDIVRLADILGHSSVNTTRIYTAENGDVHRQQIQKLGLLRC